MMHMDPEVSMFTKKAKYFSITVGNRGKNHISMFLQDSVMRSGG